MIAGTVLNKYILLNDPIPDDGFIWAESQIYVMFYLFSSYPELDLLTLIAFSCCYTTNIFCCFLRHQCHLCRNIFFCDQSFLALLTQLCSLLILLQSNEQQDAVVCALCWLHKTIQEAFNSPSSECRVRCSLLLWSYQHSTQRIGKDTTLLNDRNFLREATSSTCLNLTSSLSRCGLPPVRKSEIVETTTS